MCKDCVKLIENSEETEDTEMHLIELLVNLELFSLTILLENGKSRKSEEPQPYEGFFFEVLKNDVHVKTEATQKRLKSINHSDVIAATKLVVMTTEHTPWGYLENATKLLNHLKSHQKKIKIERDEKEEEELIETVAKLGLRYL